jgi:hypothetical protein
LRVSFREGYFFVSLFASFEKCEVGTTLKLIEEFVYGRHAHPAGFHIPGLGDG